MDSSMTSAESPSRKGAAPDVDYQSLLARDRASIERLFSSAKHYGVFRVTGHGIAAEELRSLILHAEQVFGILDARNSDRQRTPRSRSSNRDELAWVCSDKERMISAKEYIGPESFQEFSRDMDNVSNKLDAIAKELGQVFLENVAKKYRKRIQQRESVISLYRYKQDYRSSQSPDTCFSLDHALSLHLAFQKSHFNVKLDGGPSVVDAGPNTVIVKEGPSIFTATPDTIIVTVGHQLQKWSKGEFKAAVAEMKVENQEDGEGNSFSIELKCSPTYLNQGLKTKITIFHQFLIGLGLVFMYKAYMYYSTTPTDTNSNTSS